MYDDGEGEQIQNMSPRHVMRGLLTIMQSQF